jgi:hypothetical protein
MATIAENLQTIKDSTAAIKQSIINKGGEISGNITTWASAIDGIETGGSENTFGEVMVDKTGNGIKQLLKIVVDDNVIVIGKSAYYYCSTIEEIVLHDMITSFEDYAFQRCEKLVSITIPPLVKEIRVGIFSGCLSLVNFFIHDNVETIGSYAFQKCPFEVFVFPANINTIASQAFAECNKLLLCDFRKTFHVPVLNNSNAFSTVNADCQFVVPDALYDEWVAATNWSTYADRIVKASEYVETN